MTTTNKKANVNETTVKTMESMELDDLLNSIELPMAIGEYDAKLTGLEKDGVNIILVFNIKDRRITSSYNSVPKLDDKGHEKTSQLGFMIDTVAKHYPTSEKKVMDMFSKHIKDETTFKVTIKGRGKEHHWVDFINPNKEEDDTNELVSKTVVTKR